MKRWFLLVIICLLVFFLCNRKTQGTKQIAAMNICNYIEVSYLNKNGEDLLNPKSSTFFTMKEMRHYYLTKGIKNEVNNSNMDCPKNLLVIGNISPFRLRIFTDTSMRDVVTENKDSITGISNSILELNSNTIDTITTKWVYNKTGLFSIHQAYYNGILIDKNRKITMIK